jgi:isopentenyldiphosphate isomerase
MKGGTKTLTKKNAMIQALEKTLGVVTSAAKKAQINRRQHYEWMIVDEVYKKRVEDIANMTLDFVESKLHDEIEEGNTACIIFYMKTKGKKRGYIEKTEQEISHNVKQPIIIQKTYSNDKGD